MNVTVRQWGIASRVVAAIGGGYALASLMSIALARALPVPHATAVMAGMLSSFLFYACAVLWVFAARTAGRAWLGLVAPGLVFALLAWWLGPAPLAP